jgi:2-dehydro-3-deoxyphosphogluconate aldolase/(4S)-4-hydroxy-2-oxoglutarate aldolase
MTSIEEMLQGMHVVPVVVIDSADTAAPLARTLLEAGLGAIEITLRTPAALDAIAAISREVPDLLVGAGSLRTAAQIDEVVDAGAKFGVSPGHSDALLEAIETAQLPFIPGAITPSESLALLDRGYVLQKLFPAGVAGGIPYLRAIGGPLPEVRFMPTGGITPTNASDYLALPNVACIGGSWIVPNAALASEDFATIAELARAAAAL